MSLPRRSSTVRLQGAGLLLTLALGPLATAAEDPPAPAPTAAAQPRSERPLDRQLGERIPDFRLVDATTGKDVSLYRFYGKKAVVIVFTGVDCPVGNLYMPRLVTLQNKYKDQGVALLTINANASETAEQVAAHAREYGLNFPVLKDHTGRVTQLLQAERTCEALVLDGSARLRYRGAIDDQYGYGVRRDEPTAHFLTDALDALLAGQAVATASTAVIGCPIERPLAPTAAQAARIRPIPTALREAQDALDPPVDPDSIGPVNYAEHVAPIVQAKCQSCHRPGEVGPFALLTYTDLKRRADGISEVVSERRMPPWHADPRHGTFVNDRRLSARERATLIAWVDQGTPEGDPTKAPAPRTWPEGWRIGTPDVVFTMPKPHTVRAEGALPYQRFRVPTNFTEDRWVQALEPRPSERSVVHHIIIYLRDPARGGGFDDLEHLAAYAPGDLPSVFPPGTAKRIPAGSELVFELHYTPIGKPVVDQSSVGLIFAKEPPKYRAITQPIPNLQFVIEPGDSNREVRSKLTLDREVKLLALFPHMHLRGKDFQFTVTYPDGRTDTLLSVPQYDFAWQSIYWLTNPLTLPKGTRIDCLAHFDNSASNAALTEADTRERVRWGEQTWDEMMIGYIDYLVPVPAAGTASN